MFTCRVLWVLVLFAGVDVGLARAQGVKTDSARSVSALGRLEPKDGVYSVAQPTGSAAVIAHLLVDQGQQVEEGEVIAVLDDSAIREAELQKAQAVLKYAQRDFDRARKLERNQVQAESAYDSAEQALTVAKAVLAKVQAEYDRSRVRAPISGRVLYVYSRRGEQVGPDGILEMGRTDQMYAVAEVYETDIPYVREGQKAVVTSPALKGDLTGTVEEIGLRVGKLDVVSTDPAARTDARVVEVKVRLDDSKVVSGLTNLQVTVSFRP
ncbi:efflux RND transporter periplasmic adaptor subunit [Myxococcota bacterium]|nr:efflux RND transporter periplasmic adaptor subunit [Myxococcota bacterium]